MFPSCFQQWLLLHGGSWRLPTTWLVIVQQMPPTVREVTCWQGMVKGVCLSLFQRLYKSSFTRFKKPSSIIPVVSDSLTCCHTTESCLRSISKTRCHDWHNKDKNTALPDGQGLPCSHSHNTAWEDYNLLPRSCFQVDFTFFYSYWTRIYFWSQL